MTTITKEPCPVCGDEMTVTHGVRDALHPTVFVHLEDCPTCGKSAPSVGYDCQDCIAQSGNKPGTLDRPD